MFLILLALLTSCTPEDGADYRGTGGWVHIQSPPGHSEQECWAWLRDMNSQFAMGGPQCFPKPAAPQPSPAEPKAVKPLTPREAELDKQFQTPEGRKQIANDLLDKVDANRPCPIGQTCIYAENTP